MPKWRLFYHFVWTTKKREPLITPDIEMRLHGMLRHEAEKFYSPLFYINGMSDHIHVLASIRPAISPAQFAQQLKGSSSHFVTHQLERGFDWQDDYAVFSVCEQEVPRVIQYIKNQKQHHANNTLTPEWEYFDDTA
ncbi:MAG: hypothetical protein B6D41_00100 [Chloroflexi bacterium UTCFX4]|jgi:putative transposase|nr:MAG: hypothetical protein B6D41_00100 [Chloroflexi bacterium UTCFX4]